MPKMPKLIEPMFSEHISGLAASGAASRSSSVIFMPPPVVMFTTASVACLMRGRKRMNTAGSGVGRPVSGSRACRCRIEAPASAASMAWVAISSGVTGSAADIVGVWMPPVTAQVMMTLRFSAAMSALSFGFSRYKFRRRRTGRRQPFSSGEIGRTRCSRPSACRDNIAAIAPFRETPHCLQHVHPSANSASALPLARI